MARKPKPPKAEPAEQPAPAAAAVAVAAPPSTPVEASLHGPPDPAPAPPPADGRETLELAWPLPDGLPESALAGAVFIVRSRSLRGFRRAGFAFPPADVELPLAELSPAQREAIGSERELVVRVRLAAPS